MQSMPIAHKAVNFIPVYVWGELDTTWCDKASDIHQIFYVLLATLLIFVFNFRKYKRFHKTNSKRVFNFDAGIC